MPSNTPRAIVTTPNDIHHDTGSLQSAAGNSKPQASQANNSSVSGRSRSRVPNPSSTHAPPHGTQPWRGSGSSGMRNATHFQGSRRTTISGGQFLNTLGHHTNLTVNLNQPGYVPSGEEDSPCQGSHPDAGATLRDVDRLNELRNRNMQAVMQLPVQRSNEIYERHLMLKGRGFPLWIPEPNKNLSMIYQRQGINIGDVGLVTYAGSFSFLFNICLPADHPINPRIMPEGFAPIDPPIDPGDVRRFTEFKSGSFLGSNSIVKSSEPDDNSLSFESQSSEGAILVMPEGAVSYDFENIPQFRKYIADNVESWYRYANGPRGREAKNGELRLVIGCDKSTSWGMATMSDLSQEHNSRLTLLSKKTEPTDSQNPQPVGYTWEYSGVAEVRAGPDPEEIEELRVDDPEPSVKYANQSLFIRTLNPTLGPELWEKVNRDLGLSDLSNAHTKQEPDSVNPTQQNRDDQLTPSYSKSRHTAHSGRRHAGSIPDDLQEDAPQKGDDVNSSLTPEIKQRFHPSNRLNRLLSETYPQARIIITEDRDWYSVIKEEETELPPGHELYRRTLDVSNVEYDDGGVLYLKTTNDAGHPSSLEETRLRTTYTTLMPNLLAKKLAGLSGVHRSFSSYLRSKLSSPQVADDSQLSSTSQTVDPAHEMKQPPDLRPNTPPNPSIDLSGLIVTGGNLIVNQRSHSGSGSVDDYSQDSSTSRTVDPAHTIQMKQPPDFRPKTLSHPIIDLSGLIMTGGNFIINQHSYPDSGSVVEDSQVSKDPWPKISPSPLIDLSGLIMTGGNLIINQHSHSGSGSVDDDSQASSRPHNVDSAHMPQMRQPPDLRSNTPPNPLINLSGLTVTGGNLIFTRHSHSESGLVTDDRQVSSTSHSVDPSLMTQMNQPLDLMPNTAPIPLIDLSSLIISGGNFIINQHSYADSGSVVEDSRVSKDLVPMTLPNPPIDLPGLITAGGNLVVNQRSHSGEVTNVIQLWSTASRTTDPTHSVDSLEYTTQQPLIAPEEKPKTPPYELVYESYTPRAPPVGFSRSNNIGEESKKESEEVDGWESL